jgi:hypothetical protein
MDARTGATADTLERMSATAEGASDGWTSAFGGVRELAVLGAAVTDARADLRRELLDLVLPTPGDRDRARERASARSRG